MLTIIQNFVLKIKSFRDMMNRREDLFLVTLIVLVGLGSFGLGRLSAIEQGEVRIESVSALSRDATGSLEDQGKGGFVGSINSTKYHAPWCSGASRIARENEIWFASEEEAQRAGYTPAANCKGI
ncbi:MAG: hypothetical protein WD003_00655 [Candidatus Paceibacterota bacterium]